MFIVTVKAVTFLFSSSAFELQHTRMLSTLLVHRRTTCGRSGALLHLGHFGRHLFKHSYWGLSLGRFFQFFTTSRIFVSEFFGVQRGYDESKWLLEEPRSEAQSGAQRVCSYLLIGWWTPKIFIHPRGNPLKNFKIFPRTNQSARRSPTRTPTRLNCKP